MFAVAKTLFGKWPVFHFMMGITLTSFADYGIGAFSAPYFMRQFGLDLATVGLVGGLVGGVSTGAGTLIGGYLTDWLSKRTLAAYALVPAIGLSIAAPTYMIAYLQNDWHYAVALMFIPGIFHYTYLGPTFGVIQNVTDLRRRATTTALLFFFLNLIALGGGPPFVGWLIDQLTNFHFNHARRLSVRLRRRLRRSPPRGPARPMRRTFCRVVPVVSLLTVRAAISLRLVRVQPRSEPVKASS